MTIQEYEVVKTYSYNDYCEFLTNKYCAYSKDGLFKHHFYEYRKAGLSNPEVEGTIEEKTTIIFCDYLEHLLLHIMIGEQTDARKALGIGGAINYIIPQLNNYFYNNIKCYNDSYYDNLDIDVFNILIDRADHAINKINLALDHNKQLYLEVENKLNTIGKALIVLGTGLGKTSTSLEYLIANRCRALVVAPNNLIKTGWEEYSDWVDTVSYQAFSNNFNETDFSKYGLVIADEVHHAGAEVWGKPIQECLNKGIKVLGLTATPQRTDGNDIGITLFDDAVCEGYSVEEGIEKGLIHPFSYITALYDTDGIHDEYASCDNKELVGNLDLALNNCPSLKDIFIKNMPAGKRKGIIFIQDIADEKYVKDMMTEIYPDIQYKSIHSRMDKSDVEVNRTWFENTDSGYLLAVNMISEGAHYRGVNTLIMFRRTSSYLVFTQQLGRIITLVKDKNPNAIVFDLVNNIDNVEYSNRKADKNRFNISRIVTALKKTDAAKSKQIVVKDEARDIVKAIREIKAYNNQKWTDEEDRILITYYPTEGKRCESRFSRSRDSVSRARFLHIPGPGHNNWTPEDIAIIKEYYEIEGLAVRDRLSDYGKSKDIKSCAYSLGLKLPNSRDKTKITDWELTFINENINLYCANDLLKMLNNLRLEKNLPRRTREGLNTIARRINKHFIRINNWTPEEDKILYDNYFELGPKGCKKLLPSRDVNSRARDLGLKYKYGSGKPVVCVETGTIYASAKKASDILNIRNIDGCCRGEQKTAGGYHWEYVDEE